MNFCGLRKELDEQMKASDRELSDLNGKLQLLQHEHSLDLSTWSDKVGHLRSANHGQIRKMPTDCITYIPAEERAGDGLDRNGEGVGDHARRS